MIRKTLKYKLYRSKRNRRLVRQIEIAASVWNHCIALHRRYYRLYGKRLNVARLQKHITKLKKQHRFAFWNELGSQAIQDVTERVDRAYRLFFNEIKAGRKSRPPSFRKKEKYRSFTLKQAGYKLLGDNRIRIGDTIYDAQLVGCRKRPTLGAGDHLGFWLLWFGFVFVSHAAITGKDSGVVRHGRYPPSPSWFEFN